MKTSKQIEVSTDGFKTTKFVKPKIDSSIESVIARYGITPDDSKRVRDTIYPVVKNSLGNMIEDFYRWLEQLPEYKTFFGNNKELVKRVKAEQNKYWDDILTAEVDDVFFSNRVRLAETHARINLPLDSYFAGLAFFMNWVIAESMDSVLNKAKKTSVAKKEEMLEATGSFVKILQIDLAVVVDNYVKSTSAQLNELIQRQASTITKLATPIALVAQDILLVSIIGIIDSNRSQDIMETTLTKIIETTSQVTIVDIAGVDLVDTAIANHLIKMTQAIKLMGCHCILSGVSPSIAQTMVQLGIDLRDLTTKAVLKDAVELAYKMANTSNNQQQ